MIALFELVELLPPEATPKLSGRQQELLDFVREQKDSLSEENARVALWGEDSNYKYFNKLKNALKERLAMYLISHPQFIDTARKPLKAKYYASYGTYNVLLTSGNRSAAIEMGKSLLPKLIKRELHFISHSVATDLHLHYSSTDIQKWLANRYGKIAEEQLRLVNLESLVRKHHNQVSLIVNSRESYTPAMMEIFYGATKETMPLLSEDSYHINRFIYNIIINQYKAEYDYERMIDYCEQAYKSFPEDYPAQKTLYFWYVQMKLPALIAIGRLKEAKEFAKNCTQIATPNTFNWRLAFIHRCLACLHNGEYQEAYDLYKEQGKKKCPFPILREYWLIIWGYLYFLIQQGKIEQYVKEKFLVGKFLNETLIYSKDKAGHNISLLIIQILIRMQQNQYGVIIDRMEMVKVYAKKYTNTPSTRRANLFINMIVKMESASFHRTGTERKTQKLLERLQQTPMKVGQSLAVEMVPYEVLWKEVLNMLDHKFQTGRKRITSDSTDQFPSR